MGILLRCWHLQSIYKAISCQKELHSVDFRQEDITDPQVIALAEALVEMPMISTLDLRDNRITDDVRSCDIKITVSVWFVRNSMLTLTICGATGSKSHPRSDAITDHCGKDTGEN